MLKYGNLVWIRRKNPARQILGKPFTVDRVRYAQVWIYDLQPGDQIQTRAYGLVTVTSVQREPSGGCVIYYQTATGKEGSQFQNQGTTRAVKLTRQ